MFSQMAQFVGFDFVFFDTGIGAVDFAARITLRQFADFSLPKKIRALDRSGLVRRFENHPVAQITTINDFASQCLLW